MNIRTKDALGGIIRKIEDEDSVNSVVTVELPDGHFMSAVITRMSVKKLGLQIGCPLFSKTKILQGTGT